MMKSMKKYRVKFPKLIKVEFNYIFSIIMPVREENSKQPSSLNILHFIIRIAASRLIFHYYEFTIRHTFHFIIIFHCCDGFPYYIKNCKMKELRRDLLWEVFGFDPSLIFTFYGVCNLFQKRVTEDLSWIYCILEEVYLLENVRDLDWMA